MEKGIKIIEVERYGKKKQLLHPEFQPNQRAEMAKEMIAKWGFPAAVPDGETSTGHPKCRNFAHERKIQELRQTLRDQFAMAAMAGHCAVTDNRSWPGETIISLDAWRNEMALEDAKYCYMIADAMLKAREEE